MSQNFSVKLPLIRESANAYPAKKMAGPFRKIVPEQFRVWKIINKS
ncbi:MAG: hypothetical protein HDT08_00160 [Bacteroidales bacterium]|nr:hypothetical protein [Bacteroidales bacterium]MDE5836139.1 hypothetical protein [Paramuribaculum sp.]